MVWVVVAVLVLLLAGGLFARYRLARPSVQGAGQRVPIVTNDSQARGGFVIRLPHSPPTSNVIVRLVGDDRALVIGEGTDLDVIGTTISSLPDKIANGLIRANVALQSVVSAASSSGRLVMLTKESAAALKALGPMTDTSGAILGVVKDGSGQFAKVLRFTPAASKVAAIASLGPALSGIALQLQLQAISQKLDGIAQTAGRIEQNQDDELAAQVESNVALAKKDYELLQRTGVISDTHWAEIAPRRNLAEVNVRQLAKRLERIVKDLDAIAGRGGDARAYDRLERLNALEKKHPLATLDLYMRSQQAVVLNEILRVHRLISTNDPHLEIHQADSEERAKQALDESHDLVDGFDKAIAAAGAGRLTEPWYSVPSWFSEREIEVRKRLGTLSEQAKPLVNGARKTAISMGVREPKAIQAAESPMEPDGP